MAIIHIENSAQKTEHRGFALLVAVIFMSVMLAFGVALGSLSYKQALLSSSAIESQYAFYAADAALECALDADQQQSVFAFNANLAAPAPSMTCDNAAPVSAVTVSHTSTLWVTRTRLSLDSGKRCADVTVYKPSSSVNTTYVFAQAYDLSCTTVATPNGARLTSRGLEATY